MENVIVKKIGYGHVYASTLKTKPPKKHEGKVYTQPDMTLSTAKLLERSRLGMELQGFQPVYLGEKRTDFIGFERMTKQEKLDFAKKYSILAKEQLAELEAAKEIERKNKIAEQNKLLDEAKKIIESQKAAQNQQT